MVEKEEEMLDFSEKEKVELFDKITAQFYYHNFGGMSKSEIDLMMFHFYIEKLYHDNTDKDGQVNYRACSDYKISKDLGITQQRVRNMKVKERLAYPPEEKKDDEAWKKSFAGLIENARLDGGKFFISIPDPNLYIEIENYLEQNGNYIEKQLNSKLMVIRVEYFIDLCMFSEDETNKKRILKEIKKQVKEDNKDEKQFDDKNVGKSLIGMAADITSIFSNVASCFSPGNVLAEALIRRFSGR